MMAPLGRAAVLLAALVLVAVGGPGGSARAGERDGGRRLAQGWNDLSPEQRGEAYRNYRRFEKMPPREREQVERNYNRWQQLPPEEKERIRGNYRQYREMSPEQRRDFQRRYQQWRDRR